MSAGRPIAEFDLPEGWQNTILEMYKEGASDVEVKAIIYDIRGSLSNDLWERWMEEEEEFSETIKVGKMLSAAWWQKSGRTNLKSGDFNYTGWYMNMKNRFGWRDKVDTNHSGSIDTRPIQYAPQSGNEPIKD
jgi:hypothetical protein